MAEKKPRFRATDIGKAGAAPVLDWHGEQVLNSLRKATAEMVRQAADVVRDKAKNLVAVKTGALRDSIKSQARKARGKDEIVGSVKTGPGENGFRYGLAQEIGMGSRKYTFHPYLRPSLESSGPEIEAILKGETAKEAAIR